jgi:hypothetical protein
MVPMCGTAVHDIATQPCRYCNIGYVGCCRPHDALVAALHARLRYFNDKHGRVAPRVVIAGPFEAQTVFVGLDGRIKLAPNLDGFSDSDSAFLDGTAVALAVFAAFALQPIWTYMLQRSAHVAA